MVQLKAPRKAFFAIQTPTERLFEHFILGSKFSLLVILAINYILFSNWFKYSGWKILASDAVLWSYLYNNFLQNFL